MKDDEQPTWYVHPEQVTAGSIGTPVPVRYIIFPQYDAQATPELRPMSSGEALRGLLDCSIDFSRCGSMGFGLLSDLVKNAQCFALASNDLEATTGLVEQLVGS